MLNLLAFSALKRHFIYFNFPFRNSPINILIFTTKLNIINLFIIFSLSYPLSLYFSVSFPSLQATKLTTQINYHHHGTTKSQTPSRQPQGQPKNQQPTGKKHKTSRKNPKNKNHRATFHTNPSQPTHEPRTPHQPTNRTTNTATPTHPNRHKQPMA